MCLLNTILVDCLLGTTMDWMFAVYKNGLDECLLGTTMVGQANTMKHTNTKKLDSETIITDLIINKHKCTYN